MADIDLNLFQRLADAIVAEFLTPQDLEAWVGKHVPEDNLNNILVGTTFITKTKNLLLWANSGGVGMDLLQRLSDNPPNGSPTLPQVIWYLTGKIRPAGSLLPPGPLHDSLFVTQRPFANRVSLRAALQTLDAAMPGADSVLVIEGPPQSGKSHGIRLATHCAPRDRSRSFDISMWSSSQVYAWELAGAIYPKGLEELKGFDPTKEDAQVGWLFNWLSGKLHPGPRLWILIDHCSLPNLTRAASALLFRLAAAVERGSLPEVRLVIADIESGKLPSAIKTFGRWDTADLPDRKAVEDWITRVADGMYAAGNLKAACTPAEITAWADSVFEGLAVPPPREELVRVLETRMATVFKAIKAH